MPDAPEPGRGGPPNPGEQQHVVPSAAETEVFSKGDPDKESDTDPEGLRERRFTAPGFDAKETQVIVTSPDPETDIIPKSPGSGAPQPPGAPPAGPPLHPPPVVHGLPPKTAVPQSIPPRQGVKSRIASKNQRLGWILAIVVIVLALAAIAILLAVYLDQHRHPKASEEDRVRETIRRLDTALQSGDLATLRSITCGTTRDGYVEYDERAWADTNHRVAAAKQFPVIATIDEVAVNGQHAEANVTTYMAYDPQVRSTRSLDLQFRDDQWKVCQSPSG